MEAFVADSENDCYHFVTWNKVQFTNRLPTMDNVLKAYILLKKKELMSSHKGIEGNCI